MKKIAFFMVMILACFMGLGLNEEAKCDASPNVKFNVKNVYLQNGKYTIQGCFDNEGTEGFIYALDLDTTVYDMAGNCIFSDSTSTELTYGIGAYQTDAFLGITFENPNSRKYNGPMRWRVNARPHYRDSIF